MSSPLFVSGGVMGIIERERTIDPALRKEENTMSALETAEKVVSELSPDELVRFRQWFADFDGDLWDAQIERDASAGKLDALAQEALAEYHSGKATEI